MITNFINIQGEHAILGTILISNTQLSRVIDKLEEKHFYNEANKEVWKKIIELSNDNKLADSIILKEFFSNNLIVKEAGGVAYGQALLGKAVGVIDIREYCNEIIELWQKRELEAKLNSAIFDLHNNSFDKVSANLENDIAGLALQEPKKKTQHVSEMITDWEVDEAQGKTTKIIPTGLNQLDKVLNGGLHARQLCFIGARPSVGKTAISQNIIFNASKAGKKCLFISLEVDKRNVLYKFLSLSRSIPAWKIQKNILTHQDKEDLRESKRELKEMQIYVNDSSSLNITQIKQIIKNQIEKNPVDLVVVDYVQIIKGVDTKWKNESSAIKENTTMLKALAKQYDVAILALAQINRKGVESNDQEPNINDFKGSGGIEEDADVAIILHRNRNENEDKEKGYFSNTGKLIVAKNRHGFTGQVGVMFDGELGRFTELGPI